MSDTFEGFTKVNGPENIKSQDTNEFEGFTPVTKIDPTGEDVLAKMLSSASTSEDPEETAATISLVKKMSGIYGTNTTDTLNSLDSMIADYYGQTIPRKTAARAIADEWKTSRVNNKIAFLTNAALNTDDEAERQKLFEQIEEEKKFMPSQDLVPRNIFTQFGKSTASLAGSTLDSIIIGGSVGMMAAPVIAAMGASSVVAALTPKLAKIAMITTQKAVMDIPMFMSSVALERGAMANEMLEAGQSIETVKKVSMTGGIIAGALETIGTDVLIGNLPGMAQITRQAYLNTLLTDRVKNGVMKGLAEIAKENLIKIPIGILSETSTEVLQEMVAIKAAEVGSEIDKEVLKYNRTRERTDGDYISDEYKEQIKQRLKDTAVQTAQGMAVMGIMGAGANTAIDARQNTQETSRFKDSQKKATEIKNKFVEKQAQATDAITQRDNARKAFEKDPSKKNMDALKKASDAVDALNIQPAPSDEILVLNEEKKALMAEEPTPESIQRVLAIDEQINDLQRKDTPETTEKQPWQMRAADYEKMVNDYALNMNEKVSEAEQIITEPRFREKIKETTPEVNDAEIDALITLHKTRANSVGIDFETYLNTQFTPEIATKDEVIGTLPQGKKGAILFKEAKALIILSEKSDFSTWIHESGHLFRRQLEGDLKSRAESYYGVSGVWTVPQEEQFTEDLTTYLMTGKAPTAELQNVFQVIAEALIAIYKSLSGRGQLSPEIASVFDEMFNTQGTLLNQSETAGMYFQPELYHGTGSTFDRFDSKFINTGREMQAYGHGIYLTEDEMLGKDYGEAVARKNQGQRQLYKVESAISEDFDKMRWLTWNEFVTPGTRDAVRAGLKEYGYSDEAISEFEKATYKKQLSETEYYDKYRALGFKGEELVNMYEGYAKAWKAGTIKEGATGQVLYTALQRLLGNQVEASRLLSSVGIDGNKFQATKLNGDIIPGKSNYVVFDETSLNIQERMLFQGELYHGSPYSFDEFNTEAIGTGEGAQAFGWGLYYTEGKNIAKSYAKMADKKNANKLLEIAITNGFDDFRKYDSEIEEFGYIVRQNNGDVKTSLANMQRDLATSPENKKQRQTEFLNALNMLIEKVGLENIQKEVSGTRNLYTVTPSQKADFDEMTWLEWDKPLPDNISETLKNGLEYDDWYAELEILYNNNREGVLQKQGVPFDQFAEGIIDPDTQSSGEQFYRDIADALGSDKEASMFLNRAGIDGIRYPANFLSGGNKDGKSNYVVFDENAVQIKEWILFQSEITPEQQKAFDSAVTAHGLTNDINEAGYVLPDGKMLDFSGRFNSTGYKKQGDKFIAEKDDYLKNNRPVDHRDILYTDRANNGNEAMQNFISMGAIRIDADAGVVDMATLPTAQQYKVIQRVIENAGGATVEINYNGNSVNFDSEATPAKIIGQIKQFFKTGVINERMLFQSEAHRDSVMQAVEHGLYVPDDILQDYYAEDWAQAEIQAREGFKKDIPDYPELDQYIAFESTFSDLPKSYFRDLWKAAQDRPVIISREQSNKAFVSSLDKDTLQSYLKAVAFAERQMNAPDTFMNNSIKGIKSRDLSDGEYKNLMIKINADPQSYRQFFAEVLEDDEQLALLQKEKELYPDATELEKVRAENKRLRQNTKDFNRTYDSLQRSIKQYQNKLDYARNQGILLNDALKSAVQESSQGEKTIKAEARLNLKKERIISEVEKKKIKKDLKAGFKQYREHLQHKAEMERVIKLIMRKPPAMCAREYADKIEYIQERYRVQPNSPQRMEFEEWAKNQAAMTDDEKVREALNKELKKESLKEKSLDELYEIAGDIYLIKDAGVQARLNYLLEQRAMRGEEAQKIVNEINSKEATEIYGQVGTGKETKGSLLQNIKAYWWAVPRLAERLGETSKKWLYDKVNEQHDLYLKEKGRRTEALLKKMEELKITASTLAKREIIDGRSMTHDTLAGFYIAMQNDDSFAAIIYGNLRRSADPEEFMRQALDLLTDEEKQLADWMVESFSGEDKKRLFDTYIEDQNIRPVGVARYFPMMRQDETTDTRQYNAEIADELKTRSPYSKLYPSKKFTIARLKNIPNAYQSPIRVDALNVYMQAVEKQEYYIAHMKLVKDLQYIYNHKEVRSAIALKFGKSWNNTLQVYVNNIANPLAYRNQMAQMKWWGKMISNGMASALMFNAATMLKQVPSMAFFMREAGATSILASQAETAAHFTEVKNFVYENCPQIKYRTMDDYLKGINIALNNPETKARVIAQMQKTGLAGIEAFDKMTVIIGWNAVYKKVFGKTGDHDLAVKTATDVFLKTQPQAQAKDSPVAYLDERLRPFLIFTRQANQIFQMITADTPQAFRDKKYRQIMYDTAALAISGIIIGMIARRRPQDDEEEIAKDIASQFTMGLPLIGGTMSNLIQGKFYADQGFKTPLTSTAIQAYRATEKILDEYETTEEKIESGIRLITEAMKLEGLPGVLSWRAYKAYMEEDFRYVILGGPPEE